MNLTYVILSILLLAALVWWLWRHRKRPPPPLPVATPATAPAEPAAYEIDPTAEEDRLNPRPRAPEQSADECWVPPGRPATVRGYTIERGMVYVGAGLYKDRIAWKPEDCLIDPTLDVSPDNPDYAGRTVSAWPAYSKLTPNARAAFLAFLAAGADDPDAHPGYVTLYFYGLQRRLTKDRLPTGEAELLWAEVQRLQERYGHHPSFHEAASRLLAGRGAGSG